MEASSIAICVRALRAQKPLVQCLPNVVAAEITANVLLASGAAPAMVIGIQEAPEFAAKKATAVSLNCGTLTTDRLESMRETAQAASTSERKPSWVLDPVACGGTSHRLAACKGLLALRPTVLRGNASEILALQGVAARGRGVDSGDAAEAALPTAALLARTHGNMIVVRQPMEHPLCSLSLAHKHTHTRAACALNAVLHADVTTQVVTGPTDFITDGAKTYAVRGGAARVADVTGTGCALSALVIAFVAAAKTHQVVAGEPNSAAELGPLEYAAACCAFYKRCAAVADAGSAGPGSFKVNFIDALATPDAQLENNAFGIRVVDFDTPGASLETSPSKRKRD